MPSPFWCKPQSQFIDVLLASLLWRRGRSLRSCRFKTKEIPQLPFVNKVVDVLVLLVVQVPQVQFLGMVARYCSRQFWGSRDSAGTVEVPQLLFIDVVVQFVDKV